MNNFQIFLNNRYHYFINEYYYYITISRVIKSITNNQNYLFITKALIIRGKVVIKIKFYIKDFANKYFIFKEYCFI